MTREQLEAVIWRNHPGRGPEAGRAVDAILAAADTYASTTGRVLADQAHVTAAAEALRYATRLPSSEAARHRNELAAAVYSSKRKTTP